MFDTVSQIIELQIMFFCICNLRVVCPLSTVTNVTLRSLLVYWRLLNCRLGVVTLLKIQFVTWTLHYPRRSNPSPRPLSLTCSRLRRNTPSSPLVSSRAPPLLLLLLPALLLVVLCVGDDVCWWWMMCGYDQCW